MFGQKYTEEECAIIRADFESDITAGETADKLNVLPCNLFRGVHRDAKGVRAQRMKLGLRKYAAKNNAPREDSTVFDAQQAREADSAFQALLRASGARPGTFKDDTPIRARTFHPEPRFSGCSSSAELCIEATDGALI